MCNKSEQEIKKDVLEEYTRKRLIALIDVELKKDKYGVEKHYIEYENNTIYYSIYKEITESSGTIGSDRGSYCGNTWIPHEISRKKTIRARKIELFKVSESELQIIEHQQEMKRLYSIFTSIASYFRSKKVKDNIMWTFNHYQKTREFEKRSLANILGSLDYSFNIDRQRKEISESEYSRWERYFQPYKVEREVEKANAREARNKACKKFVQKIVIQLTIISKQFIKISHKALNLTKKVLKKLLRYTISILEKYLEKLNSDNI